MTTRAAAAAAAVQSRGDKALIEETRIVLQDLLPAVDEENETASLELLKELYHELGLLKASIESVRGNRVAAGGAAAAAASAPRPTRPAASAAAGGAAAAAASSSVAASAPRPTPTAAGGAASSAPIRAASSTLPTSAPRPSASADAAAAESDDEDNIPAAFRLSHITEAKEMAAKKLKQDEVLFISRRLRKMQKVYELIVKYCVEYHFHVYAWTEDKAELSRSEELCELRPSKHVPGIIGVFAKVKIPRGRVLQYPGVIVNTIGWQYINTHLKCDTGYKLQHSSLDGHFLVGNPLRIGLQINHAPSDHLANCKIREVTDDAGDPMLSSFVHFLVEEDIAPDEELLTNYGGAFFRQQIGDERREQPDEKEPVDKACDRCMLRVRTTQSHTPRRCFHAGDTCTNTRHEICFIPGESSKRYGWKCEEHATADLTEDFYIEQSMQELYAQKPRPHPHATRIQMARSASATAAIPASAIPRTGSL